MLKVKVTKSNLEKAEARANKMKNSRYTMTTSGKTTGMVAEEVFLDNFGGKLKDTRDYDILMDMSKVDIKSKICRSAPLPEYQCTVYAYQKDKDCDYYCFVRVLNDYSCVWVLGIISKEDFYKKATLCKAGTRDKTNGFLYKNDCYSVQIKDLTEVADLL